MLMEAVMYDFVQMMLFHSYEFEHHVLILVARVFVLLE